jgi:protein gp37
MNKTSIEWVINPDGSRPGWVSNPITGCLGPEGKGPCPYCYARTLANGRLRPRYLANTILPCHNEHEHEKHHSDPFFPRWWPGELDKVAARKKPAGIFLVDMGDWLGDWIPILWQKEIIDYINICKQHRFYILTKHPLNLLIFSPWPDNCYVGTTVDEPERYKESLIGLAGIKAKVKFISFEPLLGRMPMDMAYKFDNNDVQWVIIGALTGSEAKCMVLQQTFYPELTLMPWGKIWTLQPKLEWVNEIIIAALEVGIKIFLKDNLFPLMGEKMLKIREVP